MDSAILREIENNHSEKTAMEAQAEKIKKDFADELVNCGIGNEMVQTIRLKVKPIKIKKPFALRFKEKLNNFKNKLKIVFGINDY